MALFGRPLFQTADQQEDFSETALLCLGEGWSQKEDELANEEVVKWEIIELLNRFAMSVDKRDYEALRSCLTDEVNFDYSALGRTFSRSADNFVSEVKEGHRGIDGIQHVTSNHLIELEVSSAFCECNYIASHSIRSAEEEFFWSLGGRYDYRLTRTDEGWKISQCKIYVAWSSGDRQKFATAQTDANHRLVSD